MNQLLKKNDIVKLMKQHDKSIVLHKPKSPKLFKAWEYFCIIVVNGVEQQFVCCDRCKELLVCRQRDGTSSIAKHKCAYYDSLTSLNGCLDNRLKVTEYYASSKCSEIPKRIKKKIKVACVEFTALDCRAFELVSGEGFLNMAQSIFDAGISFSHFEYANVNELIPAPITVRNHFLRKSSLLKILLDQPQYRSFV